MRTPQGWQPPPSSPPRNGAPTARPSVVVVAPSGTANEAYARGTPRFLEATRSVTGSVPIEERETNASWIAGHAPRK